MSFYRLLFHGLQHGMALSYVKRPRDQYAEWHDAPLFDASVETLRLKGEIKEAERMYEGVARFAEENNWSLPAAIAVMRAFRGP